MKLLPTLLFVSTLLLLQGKGLAQQGPAPKDMLPDPNAPKPGNKSVPIKYALIMPDDKTSEKIADSERNPFSRNEDASKGLTVKASNEENVIREQLLKLRVVGQSPNNSGGMRVMLGDMILSVDQIVPQVLPEQTLSLKVGNITENAIELVWVEKKKTGMPPRKLTIPMDLRPKVRYQLQGQPATETAATKEPKKGTETRMGQQVLPGLTQVLPDKPAKKVAKTAPPEGDLTAKLQETAALEAPTSPAKDEAVTAAPEEKTPAAPEVAPVAPKPATTTKTIAERPGPAAERSTKKLAETAPSIPPTVTTTDASLDAPPAKEPLAPLKKAFELFNTLTKPVTDKQ